MKMVLTKKGNVIRIFTSERLDPPFAFWLGKCVRDVEQESHYLFLLAEETLPQGDLSFWGTKIFEITHPNQEDCVKEVSEFVKQLVQKERV